MPETIKYTSDNGYIANDLSLIRDCLNEFGESYPNMGITDWLRSIRSYVEEQKASNSNMAAEKEID